LEFAQQHHRVPDTGGQAFLKIRFERVEPTGTGLSGSIVGELWIVKVLSDGLGIASGEGADIGDGQSLAFEFDDLFHVVPS
jgi:hypothetical protein